MKAPRILGLILALSAPAFADTGDDTLRLLLSKSELVVLGEIATAPSRASEEVGSAYYSCEFRMAEVLKGAKPDKDEIQVTIARFELDEADRLPELARGSKLILFLNSEGEAMRTAWRTADLWFGVQRASAAMSQSLKRLVHEPAALIEQLDSPSQQTRDDAAAKLRTVYQPAPREKWAPLVAQIEAGETKEQVVARLKEAQAETQAEMGIGTGASYMESLRLDVVWVAQCWFQNQGDVLREISLVERMRHIWVAPAADFSGEWITYFPNGHRSHKIDYRDGKYFGEFIAYRPDGTTSYVQHYGEEGIHGEDTGYFPSGRVSYLAFYKAGKPVGTWTWYNEDGSIRTSEDHDRK